MAKLKPLFVFTLMLVLSFHFGMADQSPIHSPTQSANSGPDSSPSTTPNAMESAKNTMTSWSSWLTNKVKNIGFHKKSAPAAAPQAA